MSRTETLPNRPFTPHQETLTMLLETLPPTAVAHAMERIDPFLALVDGDGIVHERRASGAGRLPDDLASAGSLRSVLAPRVLSEWLRMIRSTTGNGCCHSALAILDGVGHDLVSIPQANARANGGAPLALLGLFPGAMPAPSRTAPRANGARSPFVHLTMMEHEWGPLEELTRCQLDTLRRVSLGLTNDEIARSIFRTKRAVEWHIRFLNETLGVRGRERLGMIGRDAGLHLFADEEWSRVVRTRPARRSHPVAPPPERAHLQPA
jgi:DNA-binding CsgD family transcriptional regulator